MDKIEYLLKHKAEALKADGAVETLAALCVDQHNKTAFLEYMGGVCYGWSEDALLGSGVDDDFIWNDSAAQLAIEYQKYTELPDSSDATCQALLVSLQPKGK